MHARSCDSLSWKFPLWFISKLRENVVTGFAVLPKSAQFWTSNSSITCNTTPNDSMNPLTATRSIRFVVALYSVWSTVLWLSSLSASDCWLVESWFIDSENLRRTSGESSASTLRARKAIVVNLCVGNGTLIVLKSVSGPRRDGRLSQTVNKETRFREPSECLDGSPYALDFIGQFGTPLTAD